MTQPQIDLINKITQEISWWKEEGELSHNSVVEFVLHELGTDWHHEEQAQLINGMNAIMSVIKRTI